MCVCLVGLFCFVCVVVCVLCLFVWFVLCVLFVCLLVCVGGCDYCPWPGWWRYCVGDGAGYPVDGAGSYGGGVGVADAYGGGSGFSTHEASHFSLDSNRLSFPLHPL